MKTKNRSVVKSFNYFRIGHGFVTIMLKSLAGFFLKKFHLYILTRCFSNISNKLNLKENV